MTPPAAAQLLPALVIEVEEQHCTVVADDASTRVEFAPFFPAPRAERVSPGHLVALAGGEGRGGSSGGGSTRSC